MQILAAEDDADLCDVLARALREQGNQVSAVLTGLEGDALASAGGYDAIVLDWNLPGITGIEICRRLRQAGDDTPILMLTARDAVDDRVYGLDAGADDYLIKPFHLDELVARLRSIVRRKGTQSAALFVAGDLRIDTRSRTVTVRDRRITLSAREYDLLEFLVRNAGITLGRDTIESHVWGGEFEASSNVVDVFIRRLRRKLTELGYDGIATVRGQGYRIDRVGETSR